MRLDKQAKEEIRAVVASEIQDVLRGEMAQWWAESMLAMKAGVPGQQAASPARTGTQAQAGGMQPTSAGGHVMSPGAGPGCAVPGQQMSDQQMPEQQRPGQGGERKGGRERHPQATVDLDRLTHIVHALARAQHEITEELEVSTRRIKALLDEAEEAIDQILSLSWGRH